VTHESSRGMTTASEVSYLKTGEDYRASLRDGREIWYQGERVEDVTTHPAIAGGVSLIARSYDEQHDLATRDVLTFVREDGARISKGWMVPRTKADLKARRECTEHIARATFGVFGRQMDMISTTHIGMEAYKHLMAEHNPELAENITRYIKWAGEQNIMLAAPVADPQGWRSRGSALGRRGIPLFDTDKGSAIADPDRSILDLDIDGTTLPGSLRVVKESKAGVWVSGAKIVASVGPQAHELLVSNLSLPDPTPESSFWMLIPVAADGVRLVCRETVSQPDASFHDHPVASRGEEMDALAIFEDVFVPTDRLCSYRWTELGRHYGNIGALEHWHTLTRLSVKADLWVGLLHLITDGIGTAHRPGVRQLVAEVIEYASVLHGMVLAAEENAQVTESGVMWPDPLIVTAGRAYALGLYPIMIHRLQELAGQGPVLRWSEKDLRHPILGPRLAFLYEGAGISAWDKNLLMNLLWDITSSSHAGRVELFENVNGFPLPYLRERLYREYDATVAMDAIATYLGANAAKRFTRLEG
jgi:4-hydroxyphenylacetate 3-monooxygenase